MSLEDHVGDVIRKAREMANVSAATAAQALGLSVEEFQALEAQGACGRKLDFAMLGRLLGLEGGRLARLAAGWHPAEPDLSQWRQLRQITSRSGMEVHCYLVWDEATRDAALFDTGYDAGAIFRVLAGEGLELRHIFITHSHADHVAALAEVRERFPRAQLHTSAAEALPQHRNRPQDCIPVGNLRVTHRPTPGHAPDGVTYIVGNWPEDAPFVAMVGDAIFAGSMGRAGAQGEVARSKVREQILSLPPETLLCPGHGALTTVAEEKANNPFFG
ncbi:MAG: MBL fold metallo-hydrolase [Verrucomicrobiae bacterium]|nr:MBL fold metallo-hydrolase [Verrucomicrobiae bacterium]